MTDNLKLNKRRKYVENLLGNSERLNDYRGIARLFGCSPSAILSDIRYIVSTRQGCTIYGLSDPETDIVRYVGQTDGDPDYRYHRHVTQAQYGRERNKIKAQWIASLLAKGKKPLLVILEKCPLCQLNKREQWWIQHFTSAGNELVNVIGRPRKQAE